MTRPEIISGRVCFISHGIIRSMLIIDSHLDLAWNALQWNRNLQQPIHLIREQEKDIPDPLWSWSLFWRHVHELGFTNDGFQLLQEMEKLDIALDVTHLTDKAFWDAMEHFNGTILASHNNCRALVPHQRQFDDEQIRAIIARGGVIGAAFDNWMLHPDWDHGEKPKVVLEDIVNHMDRVCQLAGNACTLPSAVTWTVASAMSSPLLTSIPSQTCKRSLKSLRNMDIKTKTSP